MRDAVNMLLLPTADAPRWALYLRAVGVVLQLIAAYCLANQLSPFFYQRF
jgi:hypothetical protein